MTNPLYPMLEEMAFLNGRSNDVTVREETAQRLLPHDDFDLAKHYLYGYVDASGKLRVPSTCGIQGIAAIRTYYGITGYRETDDKYIGRYTAISDMETLGKKLGVLDTDVESPPDPGDFTRIGSKGNEHVSCVADYEAETGTYLCVDGGQGQGSESKVVRRKVVNFKNKLWFVAADKEYKDDGLPNGRQIFVVLRMGRLQQAA